MIGLVFLVFGMAGELIIPLFTGTVVDYLTEEDYDKVGPLCLKMFLVIIVSAPNQGRVFQLC